ncbi:phospholysine phosphohistidine inorganic pyrophosphate phosphatase [Hyalella azteca]|uniref:Phospholysine phosphohistidine inorganic pyrophosphate phosphatase n=1 Tax=Hyalella azteca TaxID=294128 RepID=A0A8B7NYP7_HYAAZ|nr:phospholysine phosphohistidine inorganic pyrophosphate phosphatase [Hyalella azteca]
MFSGVRGLMLDVTGVLYESGGCAVPGGPAALQRLRERGYKVVLVSNESTQPTSVLVDKLRGLGYSYLTVDDVITPVPAVIDVIRQRSLNPHLLVHEQVVQEFDCVLQEAPATCVVVGDAEDNFSYARLNAAFSCLLNMPHPTLFSLGRGMYYRHGAALRLDVGAFTAALEAATGVTAEIIGKPSSLYFHSALKRLGLQPSQVVMVGDDLQGDVVGAREVGCRAVLVQTGKYRAEWATHPAPTFVARDLAHAVARVLEDAGDGY